ncbi:MAG: hypothetical protein WC130_12175, partial [Kiritimatiellia bacterium]
LLVSVSTAASAAVLTVDSYTLSPAPRAANPDATGTQLTDGIQHTDGAAYYWYSSTPQKFVGWDVPASTTTPLTINMTFNFSSSVEIHYFAIGLYWNSGSGITLPASVKLTGDDGNQTFTVSGTEVV